MNKVVYSETLLGTPVTYSRTPSRCR